jgi:hypothetical protein
MLDDLNFEEFGELQGALDDLFTDLSGTDADSGGLSLDVHELAIPIDGALIESTPDGSAIVAEANDSFSVPGDAATEDPFLAIADQPEAIYAVPAVLRLPNPFLDE